MRIEQKNAKKTNPKRTKIEQKRIKTSQIFTFSVNFLNLLFTSASGRTEFPVDTCNPFIPSKPNFQTSRLTVTLAMIRTYNETCPKKHKKNKPNTNPIQTRSKPNFPPISRGFFFIWRYFSALFFEPA